MLTVAVLGPVEVRRDGERLMVPSGKTTEVLVRLALVAGRLVRTDRLLEDLWADAVSTGRNTLQSKVSQLRRALGDPALVVAGNGGYSLEIGEQAVDALRFLRLAAAASTARRAGDLEEVVDHAALGLSLIRGEVLVDAGQGDWLNGHRARLEAARLSLHEDQLATRVDLGAAGDVITDLEALIEQHPLREGLWASLIKALYRTGRQADALATYRQARTTLIDELGIEPGPDLRGLEEQILRQSPSLSTAGSDVPAGSHHRTVGPLIGPLIGPGNLPALAAPLVGRADDLVTLSDLAHRHRLVTVVGPAGVGKTRTAVEVARGLSAPGGVWLVRLDGAEVGSASITHVVVETLQVTGGEQTLVERLAGIETVLVLDNCEHVIDAVADLTPRLLDLAPTLRVLATSRLPLGLDGETVHVLDPLPLADSVALFARRATQVRRQFVLDAETETVVEALCRALDGLPLAIELAAARVKALSLREIVRRLDDRFTLLQNPTARSPDRHRALAGAIGWSYDLLFPDDQRGLWALSCFTGGAPLEGAEHVLAALGVPAAAVVDVVSRLADRSLVSVEVTHERDVRYRVLDSIRAFALDRLGEAGLADDAASAHATWFARAADRCAATVRGVAQAECMALVRAERANIESALGWAVEHDPALGLRIANGFAWTWVVLGDGVAGAERLRRALDPARSTAAPAELSRALLQAGWLEASAGDLARAQSDLDGALALAEQVGDEQLCADAHRYRAFLRIQQGRPRDVRDESALCLAVYRRLDLPWESAAGLLLSAFGSIMLGDTVTAGRAAEEARELLTPIGDSWGLVHADAMLGAVAQADHRFTDAAAALSRAVDTSQRLGFAGQAALHLTTLGRVQHRAGDPAAAIGTLTRGIAAAQVGGDLRIAATAQVHLARIHRAAGQDTVARTLLERTDQWYRTAGGGDGALLARCLLACTIAFGDGGDGGDTRAAVGQVGDVLLEGRRTHDAEVQVLALDALARAASENGDARSALELLNRADELSATIRHLLDDEDRTDAVLTRSRIADDGP